MAKRVARDTLSGHLGRPERIDGAQVRRLVKQAVTRVADEADADAALRIALLNAGMREIPEQPAPLALFVLSHLWSAVREFVDEAAAESMVRSLKPLLKLKSELDLPKSADEVSDSEAPPPSVDLRHTVLVVESDVATRAKTARLCREAGYDAVSAAEASVALAMCVRRRPDVVVAGVEASDSGQLPALLSVAFGSAAPPLVVMRKAPAADTVSHETLLASIRSHLEG